ncbi:MAG: hypothetical protein R3274_01185 [Desulfobacterales bacterium]|nr:hypothetical protein [Desulfobacterales bacterium]
MGHCSIEYAIEAAKQSDVRRLALIQHDPLRSDAQLDELTDMHCLGGRTGDTLVFFAREGMQVEI